MDKLSYNQAMAELEEILRKMQSDSCDIDHLADMTRRASALLAECKRRLTATDDELRRILESLGSGAAAESGSDPF